MHRFTLVTTRANGHTVRLRLVESGVEKPRREGTLDAEVARGLVLGLLAGIDKGRDTR